MKQWCLILPLYTRSLVFLLLIPMFICVSLPSDSGSSLGDLSRPLDLGASRPLPFDVVALFVHQRQRSARSHSASRHSPNPPTRPGRGRIVGALRREVGNLGSFTRSCQRNQVRRLTCVQTTRSGQISSGGSITERVKRLSALRQLSNHSEFVFSLLETGNL